MKATELRIGNYYYHPIALSFERMDDIDFISSFIEKFEPIPLTEEWLLKMGFVPTKEAAISGIWFSNGFIDYCIRGGSVCFKQEPIRRIKYVHQLQNL